MATFTENYNLIKPSEEDYYDVQDFNENMDAIDGQMMETAAEVDGIGNKIGTAADEGTETVFGKLNQISGKMTGVQLVKSIQHIKYANAASGNNASRIVAIEPVNPERSLVFCHDAASSNALNMQYSFTLNTDSISVSHPSFSDANVVVLYFQIIEFY